MKTLVLNKVEPQPAQNRPIVIILDRDWSIRMTRHSSQNCTLELVHDDVEVVLVSTKVQYRLFEQCFPQKQRIDNYTYKIPCYGKADIRAVSAMMSLLDDSLNIGRR